MANGWTPERLQSLRDALVRFNEHGEVSASMGLGLTLAAAVMRAHGGRVEIDCLGPGTEGFCTQTCWPVTAPRSTPRG
jgi:K+-sensing histidine kinase KdpD